VQQLRSEANDWFDQINKDYVNDATAFMNIPLNLEFVFKIFHSIIFNESIDKHKDFTVVVKNVKYFDQRKLSLKFKEIYFEGCQQKKLSQLITEFDPLNLSEETLSFL
jgi:hypothetical protein